MKNLDQCDSSELVRVIKCAILLLKEKYNQDISLNQLDLEQSLNSPDIPPINNDDKMETNDFPTFQSSQRNKNGKRKATEPITDYPATRNRFDVLNSQEVAPEKRSNTNSTTNNDNNNVSSNEHNNKIPPIVLSNKDAWTKITKSRADNNFNYQKAKNTKDGIKIFPNSADDYRKITKFFDSNGHEYHTYELPDDKLLHIVLRNIPIEINIEDIEEDLTIKGFHPEAIHRMKNKNKNPMPLILVKLPKNEKNIFEITEINGLLTVVETLKNKTGSGQCFRCQRFGHSAKFCHHPHRCVKCGQNHDSTTCNLPKDSLATCANCGKQHPASYKGCEAFPKQNKKSTITKTPHNNKQSYAEIAKSNTQTDQSTQNTNQKIDIASAFVNLQKAVTQISQMAEFFKSLLPDVTLPNKSSQ